MEVKENVSFDIDKSAERMDAILSAGDDGFEDREYIPSRRELDYENGYYVDAAALFIDIIGSSKLTAANTTPVLAKMYRSYISECIAIMRGSPICKEICIHGDCVYGMFDIREKADIDSVFGIAAGLKSLVEILSCKLQKKGYSRITGGIGMDRGRVLMIKAGNPGSGVENILWMGDAVNSACHFSEEAGREGRKTIVVSPSVYEELSEQNRSKLTPYFSSSENKTLYEGDAGDAALDKWREEHCE